MSEVRRQRLKKESPSPNGGEEFPFKKMAPKTFV